MKKRKLTILSALLAILFFLSYLTPSIHAFAHDRHHGEEMVDIIVRYYDDVRNEDELDPSYENVRSLNNRPIQAMTVPASHVKLLMEEDDIEQIRYNQKVTTSDSHREITPQDWNNEMVNSFDAWDEGYNGQGINVAIIDTGFHNHSDINFTGGVSIFPDDPWDNDHDGHGTHVAGIIGALEGTQHQGVAPGVNLFGIKVYHHTDVDENGQNKTDVFNLIEGIEAAREMNPQPNILVISSGLNGNDPDLHQEIIDAEAQGILIVAASGNGKQSVDYPAAYEEVISVSSLDQNQIMAHDSIFSEAATPTSEGGNELAAPGVSIGGLWNDGGYQTASGSSQAAPHVAGVAALLMQKYGASASEIRTMMQENALELETFSSSYWGYGLVQYIPDEEPEEEEPTPEEPEEDDSEENESEEPQDNGNDSIEEPEENENDSESDSEDSSAPPSNNETENGSPNTETEREESSGAEESSNDEEEDDEEEDETSSAVWIRPSNTNGIATIDEEDLAAISDNGTIAISFDSSISHLTHVNLTAEQVAEIRERGINVLIAKTAVEWVIPSDNFEEGEATLQFSFPPEPLPRSEESTSDIYQFIMRQNGEERIEFPEEMIYRFFVDDPQANGEILYEWLESEDAWAEFGDTYSNGSVVGSANYTGAFGVFHPAALAETNRNIIDAQRVNAAIEPEDEEELQADRAGASEDTNNLMYGLAGLGVAILSISGGIFYFGKNKSNE